MVIKTGARAVTPKPETPPAVVSKSYVEPEAPKPRKTVKPDKPSVKPIVPSNTTVYEKLDQGTDEWLQARCGILTASVVGQMIGTRTLGAISFDCPDCDAAPIEPCQSKPNASGETRDLKTLHTGRAEVAREQNVKVLEVSSGDTAQSLMDTLIAERITNYVEPIPTSRAMERGTLDEPYARAAYAEHHAPVAEVGFITSEFPETLGYSPDGLVGEEGLIEIKSRNQKIQLRTLLKDEVPAENMAQIQTGLLVTGRKWCDYVSYCGGMPLHVKRVYPDHEWFRVILEAVSAFEATATNKISKYLEAVAGRPATERIEHFPEMEFGF